MSRTRRPELLLTFFVLVGVTSFAWARVRTAETRTLPYQGVLERNGQPVTGEVNARFGLFNAANANTACVATNSCALWSEEQVVDVVDGRFSVLLGDAGPRRLTSAILQSPELFLGVAFKTDDDAGFTALGGTQEIVGAPIVQPGAVTAASFGPGTLFSADVGFSFDLGIFFPNNQSPPGWLGFTSEDEAAENVGFPVNAGGASALKCITSNNVAVLSASPGALRISNPSHVNFTIICHGF